MHRKGSEVTTRAGTHLGRLLLVVSGLALGLEGPVRAQERPRTGLVLSGGGARGCAHVGVLKVLEELHVPVDCIVGTSMGSIVGGLYAYGISPAQLEADLTRAEDRRPWWILLRDKPDRDQQSFRRKQDENGFLIDFELGFRDGFRVPRGLYQGQNLEVELLSLTLQAHALDSFDSLPIPFRAVAVDLRTGQEVVLESGNLAMAMRASMSLPGIFAPAVIDGRSLLDGGLVQNVPTDEARTMGAMRLIVVDIGTPLSDEEAESALDVSNQMIGILTQQNVDRGLEGVRPGDVLIQPDLGDITSSDFERAAECIRIGEQAARAMADSLRDFAVDEQEFARFLQAQRRAPVPVVVSEIAIDNGSSLRESVIRSQLHVSPGRPLDVEQLRRDIERLYGQGKFESVTFSLGPPQASGRPLTVRVREKSWGPVQVRFGVVLEADLQGSSSFNLGGQATHMGMNDLGAEFRVGAQVGEMTQVNTEWYQPVVPSGLLFVAPRAGWFTSEVHTVGAGLVDVQVFDAGLDLGVTLDTWGELRLGYTRSAGQVEPQSLPLPDVGFDDGAVQLSLLFDTVDDVDFPTTGARGGAAWTVASEALGADSKYQLLTLGGAGFATLDRTTAGLGLRYQTALEDTLPFYRTPGLGGFSRLSGLERGELTGQHLALASLLLRHRLIGHDNDVLGFPLYVGGTFEAGNTWDRRSDVLDSVRLAGSLFVAVNTPIGPAYLAYGLSEGGHDSFYLFVGQVF